MKSRIALYLTAVSLIAALALPGRVVAQQHRDRPAPYPYVLIDLGTFGGPQGYISFGAPSINNRGMVTGSADTPSPDPYAPNCANSDCLVSHTFQWRRGVLTDLGALPGVNNSGPNWITESGLIAGASQNGTLDPLAGGPEADAILWTHGQMLNLGALGGNQSFALGANNGGQVVGWALNTIPDPISAWGFYLGTQQRPFLWQNGKMLDLGTLGGPDGVANVVNERGQVAGNAFTNATANPVTGLPTMDPFLWQNGRMLDLGTLGGTQGLANGLNNRGQVVGQMNLAGDLTSHPFLWDRGKLTDLGTLGGTNGGAAGINDAGDVFGSANLSTPCPGCGQPQVYHPFLWRNGVMTDLGVVPGDTCGVAYGINARAQVVGASGHCHGGTDAFLWQQGSIVNLNSQVRPTSLHLTFALSINDRGEIVCAGVLPNGDARAVLLIPTDEADDAEITQNAPMPGAADPAVATHRSSVPSAVPARLHTRLPHAYTTMWTG